MSCFVHRSASCGYQRASCEANCPSVGVQQNIGMQRKTLSIHVFRWLPLGPVLPICAIIITMMFVFSTDPSCIYIMSLLRTCK